MPTKPKQIIAIEFPVSIQAAVAEGEHKGPPLSADRYLDWCRRLGAAPGHNLAVRETFTASGHAAWSAGNGQ